MKESSQVKFKELERVKTLRSIEEADRQVCIYSYKKYIYIYIMYIIWYLSISAS